MNAADWLQHKTELVRATTLERDALHIYFGLLVQIAAALAFRRKLGDWLPWFAVLALALCSFLLGLAALLPFDVAQIGRSGALSMGAR